MMEETGFQGGELVAMTGFNSSRVTTGVLIRAGKEARSLADGPAARGGMEKAACSEMPNALASAPLDPKTRYLLRLSASLAVGCEEEARQARAGALTHGAAEAELHEAAIIAAQVGAAKVRLLHEQIAGTRSPAPPLAPLSTEKPPVQGSGFT